LPLRQGAIVDATIIAAPPSTKNRAKAQIHSLVEHPFHVVKNRFDHPKVRYRGLAKNTAQLFSLFSLSNLAQSKHRLLAQGALRLESDNRAGKPAKYSE
jgi:IS5 family transposase